MVEADETVAAEEHMSIGRRLVQFILKPAPAQFTATNFLARAGQHAVVYTAAMIVAVCACTLISFRM
jgi:hypothetical protein